MRRNRFSPGSTMKKVHSFMPVVRPASVAIALAGALFLNGCGGGSSGGGGGGSAPPPPSAPPAPVLSLDIEAIKRFGLTWPDVAGETEYRLLENPDGSTGYGQVATIAANATSFSLEVFLPARVNASYILQACNSVGCSDSAPVFVSGNLAAGIGYFKSSNTAISQVFGVAVAISGDGRTLAVGAPSEGSSATGIDGNQGDTSAPFAGAVYVFARDGDDPWSQQAYVKASNTREGDQFGTAVALDGTGSTLVVGAIGESSGATTINGDQADVSVGEAGAVYVFTRNAQGEWSQQAYIKPSSTGPGHRFGNALALSSSGDTLAAGTPRESSSAAGIDPVPDDEGPLSGAVYVFTRDGSGWSEQAFIKASNAEVGDLFGSSVALSASGDILAAGAPLEDSDATGIDGNESSNAAFDSGAVYLFSRDGTATWSQLAYVKASNTGSGHEFGHAVALSGDGDTLAVGAPLENSSAAGIDGTPDELAPGAGAAYVFVRDGSSWSQQAYVKASNSAAGDQFGQAVALSGDGDRLAVGAHLEDGGTSGIGTVPNDAAADAGAAYLFVRQAGQPWAESAYLKAPTTTAGDQFGFALAQATAGDVLAVGARFENSSATGIGGNQQDSGAANSGAVYLY
jgi:trimeric autotransporter adhesin